MGIPLPPHDQRIRHLEACSRVLPALWRGETVDEPALGLAQASLGPIAITLPELFIGGASLSRLRSRSVSPPARYDPLVTSQLVVRRGSAADTGLVTAVITLAFAQDPLWGHAMARPDGGIAFVAPGPRCWHRLARTGGRWLPQLQVVCAAPDLPFC